MKRTNHFQLRLDECVYVVRHISPGDKAKLKAFHESYVASSSTQNDVDTSTDTTSLAATSSNHHQLNRRSVRVFRVDRLFMAPNGESFVFGFYYAYPHETFCEPTRRFYPKEVTYCIILE